MFQRALGWPGLLVALCVIVAFERAFERAAHAAEVAFLTDLIDATALIESGNFDLARVKLQGTGDGQAAPFRRLITSAGLAKIDLMRQNYAGLAGHAAAYARHAQAVTSVPAGQQPLAPSRLTPGLEMVAIHLLDEDLASARLALGDLRPRLAALRGTLPEHEWAVMAANFYSAHVAYLLRSGSWAIAGWDDDDAIAEIADALKARPISEIVAMKTLNVLRSFAAGRLGEIERAEGLAVKVLNTPLVKATGSIAILELHLGCLQAVRGARAAAADSLERAVAAAGRTGGRLNIGSLIQGLRDGVDGQSWPQDLDPQSAAYAVGVVPKVAVTLGADLSRGAPVFVHGIDHTFDIEMRP